jgi:PAS domain S-box-containing protein
MNYYALIPLTAFIISFFTSTYVLAQKRKSPVNRAYLIASSFIALWNLGLFFLWLPVDENFLLTLEMITTTAGFIMSFCFLNFTYVFLGRQKDYIYHAFSVCLIISSILNIFTNLYVDGYTKYHWGVTLKGGVLFVPIVLVSIFLPTIYSLLLIYRAMKNVSNKNVYKQLYLLLKGTGIVLTVGFVFDVFLPYFLNLKEIIRLGAPFVSVQFLFVFSAVKKYNFLSIGIEEVSHDLFSNIRDGIILIDPHEYILQMNEAAKEIFDLSVPNIQHIKVSNLFENYEFNRNYKDYETRTHNNNGQRTVSLSQATIMQRNIELGKILIFRDITESKKVERELKDSKVKLERLTGELVQANTSLEQKVVERTKSLLISNERLQREILERKRAEEELAAEKERLAVTLGSIGDGVITTDTTGHIALLNNVAVQLTGWSQAEAIGQHLTTVVPLVDEKTRQPCEDPVQEALHTATVVSRSRPSILPARDGTERIIAESAAPIRAGDGNIIGVVIVFRDMTERRRIEEELLKADKLESIGMLAGGIAHDFNNILTAILGNVSLAKMYADPGDKVFTRLINAEKAALQAQNLTQQLLTFSKGGSLVRKTASLIDLLKDSIAFSMRGANVRCELCIEPGVWPVDIDEGRISQVINNLLINATQAMPDGGIIEVRVENVALIEDSTDPFLPLPAGDYVKMSVKDLGIGIPEDNLQKIFDPYFTTKQKGSGLGLFTCYSIIKKHEGHIAVESCPGIGTTFHVYIPASRKRVLQPKSQQTVQYAGTGHILIMEDEEIIRDVTGEMLSHYGYEVAFARDGTEAIALYSQARESGTPFDVIIMDLTIPGGMGGKEAVKKILEIDPHAKAIVASGYANDPIVVEFRQYGFCDRIVKPYKSEELHETLHRLIHGTSS